MSHDPDTEVPVRLGTFKVVSGKVAVSDPCYDTDVGCRASDIPTTNGLYEATVFKKEFGRGKHPDCRCVRLEAALIGGHGTWKETDFDIGVDSGQAGIFDAKHYKDDKIGRAYVHTGEDPICEDDPWYSMCCDVSLGDLGAGVVPYGANSSSGFGDGGYALFVRYDGKVATGFRIIFIDEVEEQEALEP